MRTRLLCTSLVLVGLAGCGQSGPSPTTAPSPPKAGTTPGGPTATTPVPVAHLDLRFTVGDKTANHLRCPQKDNSECAQYTREVLAAQLFPIVAEEQTRRTVAIVRRKVTVTGTAFGKPVQLTYPRRGRPSQLVQYALLQTRFPFLPKPASKPKGLNVTKSTGKARTTPDPSVAPITRPPTPPASVAPKPEPARPGTQTGPQTKPNTATAPQRP